MYASLVDSFRLALAVLMPYFAVCAAASDSFFVVIKIVSSFNFLKRHNNILVLDFHSMPSKFLNNNVDIIIGNNFDLSSNNIFTSKLINHLDYLNYSSCINDPYSGGYITKNYGKPMEGVNVLQIEINRSLYMNEDTLEIKVNKFNDLSNNINYIIKSLVQEINKYNLGQLN